MIIASALISQSNRMVKKDFYGSLTLFVVLPARGELNEAGNAAGC
jgi:hypothetical protein